MTLVIISLQSDLHNGQGPEKVLLSSVAFTIHALPVVVRQVKCDYLQSTKNE